MVVLWLVRGLHKYSFSNLIVKVGLKDEDTSMVLLVDTMAKKHIARKGYSNKNYNFETSPESYNGFFSHDIF